MLKKRSDRRPGHDGAWLAPVTQPDDSPELRYSLLDRFHSGWTSPQEGLRNLQALSRLGVLPEDAVFYLIASVLVDEIAPPRILSLLDEILSEIDAEALENGDNDLEFDDHWVEIAAQVTAETMCDHQEWQMADLFLHHRLEFSHRIESGRRYFNGE